ncbi:protein kinase [Nocardia sp. NPDC052566]|uniref:serine/threonine-protein kinase n=1 Tax=Nocardia sp. NPDC052566 TaxID=3364330 RepID=UPI0037C9E54E
MVELRQGDEFAGYVIDGVLGAGGMGTVYVARHPRLPRLVAVKLINRDASADPEVRRRFEREADVVARLNHPGIVGIYDRGTDGGHLWFSMPYIRGTDASTLDARATTVERAVRIVGETAAALDYAHSRGVLHRDVKPANIMLAAPEGSLGERALLTDFGIARWADADTQLTATGTFSATVAFASPEQLTGATLDHGTDQYSLACTFFALLAGQPPFPGSEVGRVVAGHLGQPAPRLTAVRPDMPPAIDAVLARAMAKKPDRRFPSCGAFAAALAASIGANAVPAVPSTYPVPPADAVPVAQSAYSVPPVPPARLAPTQVNRGAAQPFPVAPRRTGRIVAGVAVSALVLAAAVTAGVVAVNSGKADSVVQASDDKVLEPTPGAVAAPRSPLDCPSLIEGGRVVGNGPGDTTSGPSAILAMEYAYYVSRSGEQVREVADPDGQVPAAAGVQSGIDQVPVGTVHCVVIARIDANRYSVAISEQHPDGRRANYSQIFTTVVRNGRTLVSAVIAPAPR